MGKLRGRRGILVTFGGFSRPSHSPVDGNNSGVCRSGRETKGEEARLPAQGHKHIVDESEFDSRKFFSRA